MKNKQTLKFDKNTEIYTIQLKKNSLWWLLLLLFPLLLLILQIEVHKKIAFKTIDKKTQITLANVTVDFKYQHFKFLDLKNKKFFYQNEISLVENTNENGLATFDVSFSLYQKFFKNKSLASVTATGNCLISDTISDKFFNFLKNSPQTIELSTQKDILNFFVIDKFDGQPLPDAKVILTTYISGQKITDTLTSDARGIVDAKIIHCSDSISLFASKFGYKNFKNSGITANFRKQENRKIPLSPIMSNISLTVKDLYTKQPVPNANVKLIIENSTYSATTNTNGIGKAAFDSVAINKQMYIEVSHPAYYDTTTEKIKVSDFINLPEEKRTVFIRPKPGNITFYNVDKYTGEPIDGVKNEVFVNGTKKGEFYSNSNGEFVVPGLSPTDKISIVASKEGYLPNNSTVNNKTISSLNTKQKRTIPLEPDLKPRNQQPPRKNCRAHFSGTLLSDVYVDSHMSIIYQPDKYGEYVGEGEYPSNALAFPNAVKHTFDAIAVDKGTRVILYSKPNFQGKILLDVTGPALINNVKWKNDSRIKNVNKKNLKGQLQALFPQSCRRWSSSDMNAWSNGSCKVICEQQ